MFKSRGIPTLRIIVACLVFSWMALTFVQDFGRAESVYGNQVAVLMYHHVHDEDQSTGTITTKLFRDQLTYLRQQGYQFISLDAFKRFMNGGAVPEKAVLVTFDDGYSSFYTNAFPILKDLQIPAVNFLITHSLDHPEEDIPPKLSRDQIRAMLAESKLVDVQCHTHDFHGKDESNTALLLKEKNETDEAYKARIAADTHACIKNIEELSQKRVDTMAYPYGIYNANAAESVHAAGIQYAFTIRPAMSTRGTEPMNLPRINAGSPNITPEGLARTIERRIVTIR